MRRSISETGGWVGGWVGGWMGSYLHDDSFLFQVTVIVIDVDD